MKRGVRVNVVDLKVTDDLDGKIIESVVPGISVVAYCGVNG